MKKLIILTVIISLLSFVPVTYGQGRYRQIQCGTYTHRHGNVIHSHYSCDPRHKHGRSFWDKHRDKLTVIGGAGTGAIIGGLFGGKKGAAIGAIVGGGGSAIYTYGIRKRRKKADYRRY